MLSKPLHLKLPADIYDDLYRIAGRCQLNGHALGVILLRAAIVAVKSEGDTLTLPFKLSLVKPAAPGVSFEQETPAAAPVGKSMKSRA